MSQCMLDKIILEHTRLAKEFINLPANGGSTPEEAAEITRRKEEIKQRIQELREETTKILNDGRINQWEEKHT